MNPYASHLGNRDPQEVMAATSKQLPKLIETVGSARAEQSPAPGKWSPREIVCHLADCEVVFAYRLRQALAEDHHVVQPFDQDQFAKTYAGYKLAEALATFTAVRNWNLAFIKSLTTKDFAKSVTHPERGKLTVQEIVETMAGHDINHLKQLETIASRSTAA